MADQPLTPTEIGRELAALRAASRISARSAGEKVGVAQSTLSRYEAGRFLPDDVTLRALFDLYGADRATRDRVLAGVQARAHRPPQVALQRPEDSADRQVGFGQRERDSVAVTTLGATVIPGLLQSEQYMRAVVTAGGRLSGERLEAWVANRLWRQRILTESGRTFTQLLLPGPLLWAAGSAELMTDQLHALILASRLPTVRLGVVPPGRPVDVFPLHNIDYYQRSDGGRTVIVGTLAGTAVLEDPVHVDRHVAMLAKVEALAVFGDEARAVLADTARMYRDASHSQA